MSFQEKVIDSIMTPVYNKHLLKVFIIYNKYRFEIEEFILYEKK